MSATGNAIHDYLEAMTPHIPDRPSAPIEREQECAPSSEPYDDMVERQLADMPQDEFDALLRAQELKYRIALAKRS